MLRSLGNKLRRFDSAAPAYYGPSSTTVLSSSTHSGSSGCETPWTSNHTTSTTRSNHRHLLHPHRDPSLLRPCASSTAAVTSYHRRVIPHDGEERGTRTENENNEQATTEISTRQGAVDVKKPRRQKSKRTQSRLLSKFSAARNRVTTTTTGTIPMTTDAVGTGTGTRTGTGSVIVMETGSVTAVTAEANTTTSTTNPANNNSSSASAFTTNTPFFFKHKSKHKPNINPNPNPNPKARTKSKSKLRNKPNPDTPSPPPLLHNNKNDDDDDPLPPAALFTEDAPLLHSLTVLYRVRRAVRVLDERAQGHCDALLMAARTQRMLGETMSDMVEPFLLLTSSSSSSDGSSNSWNDDGDEEEKEMVEGGDNNINNNDENDGNVMNELNNKQHQKKMKKKIVTKKNVSNNKKDEEDKTDNIPLKPRRRITPTTTKHYPLSSSSTSVQVSSRPSTTTVNQSQQLARPFQQPSHPYNHEDLLLQSALGRGLRHASSSFGHALCSTIGNPISQLRTSFDDRFIRKIIPLLELYTEQKRAYLKLSSGRGREGENERALRRAMRPVWMRTSMQLRSEADVMACLTMGRLDKWVRGVIIQQERGLAVAMVNMKEAFERARVMTSGSSGGDEDEMMKMELMQNDSSRTEKQKKKKKKEDGQQHVLMTSTTSGAAAGPRQLGM